MDAKLILGSTVAGLACGVAHYFPPTDTASPWWPAKRLGAYVFGVGAIIGGIGVALGWRTMLKVLGISAVAGAATGGAYLLDWHLNMPIRSRYERGRGA